MLSINVLSKAAAVLIATVALQAGVACGGDAGSDDRAASIPVESTPASTDASRLIQESIEATNLLTAYRMDVSFSISGAGASMEFSGEMFQRAPSDAYVRIRMGGPTMEFLALPPDVYVRQEGGAWSYVPGDGDPSLRKLADGQSIDEYAVLMSRLEDVTIVEEGASVNGRPHSHLRGTFDLETYIESLPSDEVDPETLRSAQLIRPATFDLWVDAESKLIGRMEMLLEMSTPGGDGVLKFIAFLDGYNDSSAFPARPVDAPVYGS